MLLRQQGEFNDLSPKLRDELTKKVQSFGKRVRYKFEISNPNPDPLKENGAVIWPNVYTLQPATFYINDKQENRGDKSNSKQIGLVEKSDERGFPIKFKKINVLAKDKGILTLELEEIQEHFDFAMYLEMHPKLTGGQFADKSKRQVVTRIDEHKLAKEQRELRSEKLKALSEVQSMSDEELKNFADAMLWDSTEELDLIRNKAEELAETNPIYLNDKIKGKTIEYQALVKQAIDKGVIGFDPAEYKFIYRGNNQTITILTPAGKNNEVEKFAEWLQVGGAKTDEIYKKIKSLVK